MAPPLEGVGREALARVREQARIQVEAQDAGRASGSCCRWTRRGRRAGAPPRASSACPEPSEGDLFFDIEGDPFALDDGVDYLFGILEPRLPEDDERWAAPAASGPRSSTRSGAWTRTGEVTWAAEKAAFERPST